MSDIVGSYPSKLPAPCQLIRGSEINSVSCWLITNNSAKIVLRKICGTKPWFYKS